MIPLMFNSKTKIIIIIHIGKKPKAPKNWKLTAICIKLFLIKGIRTKTYSLRIIKIINSKLTTAVYLISKTLTKGEKM